jgi:hypothetical protein
VDVVVDGRDAFPRAAEVRAAEVRRVPAAFRVPDRVLPALLLLLPDLLLLVAIAFACSAAVGLRILLLSFVSEEDNPEHVFVNHTLVFVTVPRSGACPRRSGAVLDRWRLRLGALSFPEARRHRACQPSLGIAQLRQRW